MQSLTKNSTKPRKTFRLAGLVLCLLPMMLLLFASCGGKDNRRAAYINSQYRNSQKPDPYARFRQMTALNRHRRGGISGPNQELMLKLYAMQLEQNAQNDKLAVGLTVGTKAAEAVTATTVAMTTAISENRDRRATAEDYSRRLDTSLAIERIRADAAVQSAALNTYGYGGRTDAILINENDRHNICSSCNSGSDCACTAALNKLGYPSGSYYLFSSMCY